MLRAFLLISSALNNRKEICNHKYLIGLTIERELVASL